MKPEYKYGDILIRRVKNGWLVATGSDVHEDKVEIYVYEDEENPNWIEESLYNLLTDQFEHYMQSKRSAGIKISFSHKSIEEEEMEQCGGGETTKRPQRTPTQTSEGKI
jgi:hypothetical protein